MSNALEVTRDGAVATATLSRPERLNAIDRQLLDALDKTFHRLEHDPAVRAVVVTGAGDRAFSAGADINELAGLAPASAYELMRHGQQVFDRIEQLPKPVVAAINGLALGGGLELALACDVRVAADSARVGSPEITLANVPGWGGTQRLPRLIGSGRASALILTGRTIDAATAERWGLVTDVTDAASLAGHAADLARQLAGRSATAVTLGKQLIRDSFDVDLATGLQREAEAVAACCDTAEQRAAVQAFLNKSGRGRPGEGERQRAGGRGIPGEGDEVTS